MKQSKPIVRVILLFLCIVVLLLIFDQLVLNGMILRDFLSLFIHKEMPLKLIFFLLGEPQRDIGSGQSVFQWDMPFGAHYYVTSPVANCLYESNNGSIQGMLLPLLIILIAVAGIMCYRNKKQKDNGRKENNSVS